MVERSLSLAEALRGPREQGLLTEDDVARIDAHLQGRWATLETGAPWYIKLFIALGAWSAAICFLLFLAIAGLIEVEWPGLLVMGLLFIAGATVLRRMTEHLFSVQLALAVSISGHAMILVGVYTIDYDLWPSSLAALALCGVLYPLYRDALHRFLSCLLVPALLIGWFFDAEFHHGFHLIIFLEAAGTGLLFNSHRSPRFLRPLAYALAVSLPLTLLLVIAPDEEIDTSWWPSGVVLTLGLLWLYVRVAGGATCPRREPMIVAIVATVFLGAVSTPGVLAALGLVVLGYARRDWLLLGLGLVFFPTFLVAYYYDLDVGLLTKSGILAASGVVLLLARWYLGFRVDGWFGAAESAENVEES